MSKLRQGAARGKKRLGINELCRRFGERWISSYLFGPGGTFRRRSRPSQAQHSLPFERFLGPLCFL